MVRMQGQSLSDGTETTGMAFHVRALGCVAAVIAVFGLAAVAIPASAGKAHPAGYRDHRSRKASSAEVRRAAAAARDDGTVRVLVGLKTEFAPEPAISSAARADQRSQIVEEQQDVRQALEGEQAVTHEYDTVPYIALTLDEDGVAALAASGEAASISIDAPHEPTLAQSTTLVEANTAWADGLDGAGRTIAVLDTGVDKSHPFLAGRVTEEACFSGAGSALSVCGGDDTASTRSGSGVPCIGFGICDHGTHVAGIAAGAGSSSSGVAKGANVMSVQVFSSSSSDCGALPSCLVAYTSDIIAGLERVYAVRSSESIAAVNMSLGGDRYTGPCDFDPTKPAIDNLLAAGIPTVIATGNSKWSDSIAAPACVSSAIAVGSTTKTDQVSSFSNNHRTMTDLLAPGSGILSSTPGNEFHAMSGTSMATPHVAGAFAVLRQAAPTASVADMLSVLQSTGEPVTDTRPASDFTRRRIRVASAAAVLEDRIDGVLHAVTVAVGGTGKGRITGPGIYCTKTPGTDCVETSLAGSTVTISAKANRGSRFVGWTGDLASCGRSRSCEVGVTAPRVGGARFRRS